MLSLTLSLVNLIASSLVTKKSLKESPEDFQILCKKIEPFSFIIKLNKDFNKLPAYCLKIRQLQHLWSDSIGSV